MIKCVGMCLIEDKTPDCRNYSTEKKDTNSLTKNTSTLVSTHSYRTSGNFYNYLINVTFVSQLVFALLFL